MKTFKILCRKSTQKRLPYLYVTIKQKPIHTGNFKCQLGWIHIHKDVSCKDDATLSVVQQVHNFGTQ